MAANRQDRNVEEPVKEPEDPRSPFQRDRDRLLYAPEFRRLAAVTQVAASTETRLFHTRLTHTLKVAQLARRLAERHQDDESIDPDVAETAALAHDIGHPPFGHIAEAELDKLLVNHGVADGFEGNAQSLRIVTRLTTHSSGRQGLNLTRASLQALTKYPWARASDGKKHRKYGAYFTETDIFNWSREGLTAELSRKQTAEAAIMDWADDVAYALHDLEDFYAAGLVPLDRLARDDTERTRFLKRTRARWNEQLRPITDTEWREHENVAESLFRELPLEREPTQLMRKLVAAKANLYSSGLTITAGTVHEDPDMRMQLDLLKSLTWTYVIESPALAMQQRGQRRIIKSLFRYFLRAVAESSRVLPEWAQGLAESASDKRSRVRVACDIVASLSETQAIAQFNRIQGIDTGSILDRL